MMTLWGFLIGLPLLAFGGVAIFSPVLLSRFTHWFRDSKNAAAVLTTAAWFWTAYECDNLGIASIDAVTKAFPGELWILAAALTYLTVIWMPKNLPVRALTGILMLLPAELFKTTRLHLPPAGTFLAPTDLFVLVAYAGAVVGMYGMFYPARLEKGMDFVLDRPWLSRTLGGVCACAGLGLIAIGLTI